MIRAFHWTSAAQNGPVIRICSKCGALLLDDTESCSFCAVAAAENGEIPEPVTVGANSPVETPEPEWRVEVSRRLEQYRARRGHLRPDDPQSGLPFQHAVEVSTIDEDDAPEPERPRPRP